MNSNYVQSMINLQILKILSRHYDLRADLAVFANSEVFGLCSAILISKGEG